MYYTRFLNNKKIKINGRFFLLRNFIHTRDKYFIVIIRILRNIILFKRKKNRTMSYKIHSINSKIICIYQKISEFI